MNPVAIPFIILGVVFLFILMPFIIFWSIGQLFNYSINLSLGTITAFWILVIFVREYFLKGSFLNAFRKIREEIK